MTDLAQRLADLSPAQRVLLEQRLMERLASTQKNSAAIPRRTELGPAPLSYTQERLWFLDQLYPGQPTYNESVVYRLIGDLDFAALQAALTALVERHEVLRTVFHSLDGVPQQVIEPPRPVPLPLVVVGDAQDPLAAAISQFTAHIDAPFDLAHDLMLRVTIFRLGACDHLLLLVNHHIASDAWSARPRLGDLAEFYAAAVEGRAPHLPALPVQYADYATWQRRWLQGDRLESHLAFWRTTLAELQPLVLPVAHHLADGQPSQRGAEIGCNLPQTLVERLRSLAQAENATLYMALLAAFSVLLGRYSDQQDIALGTPTANRRHVEVESLIGSFINTLVMRVDLSGQPTFRTLLRRVRQTALAAYDHQEIPFERLVEDLRPKRRLHQNPLINVIFQVHNLTPPPPSLPGLTMTRLDLPDGHAKFDLDCSFVAQADGLRGRWRYAIDTFDAPTMERMIGHFQTLLAGIVADPDCPIDQLPLLTPVERQQMLVEWNQTAVDFPADQCIHDLISTQAARTPSAIAVICGDERISYADLLVRAERLAARLQEMGIGADDLVALYLSRSASLIVALLAVLKAGAAYVPLDPDHPAQRTMLILNDAHVRVLLTEGSLLGALPSTRAAIVNLDDPAAFHPARPLQPYASPENLAYLLYTSGSTGRPKGVAVEHRSVVNVLTAVRTLLSVTEDDRWLAITTLTFDIASIEILLPLAVGACVILARAEESKDPWRLQTLLNQSEATILQATPTAWRMLIDAGWSGTPGLRMISGGEALSLRLAQDLLARGGQLWNLYGPTETTIYATFHAVRGDEGAPPIGRPLDNTQLYVLDPNGQPTPVGVSGELYIGGIGLARGYYGQPDLTAERFVANPFVADSAARLYRTGDLVRWREDGVVEYLRRNDHQVKIRGHRIELDEVQAALSQHPAVQTCVVLTRPTANDELQIVAYFVPRQGAGIAPDAIKHFLRATLPEAMIPAACIELAAVPTTPSGKLDRAALPDPTSYIEAQGESFAAPQSPLEEVVARIWSTVLGRAQIGIHENFFDLGGHSLMATRVVSRLRSHLQIDLPLSALFEAPTIAGLATAIAMSSASPLDLSLLPTARRTEQATEEFVL